MRETEGEGVGGVQAVELRRGNLNLPGRLLIFKKNIGLNFSLEYRLEYRAGVHAALQGI